MLKSRLGEIAGKLDDEMDDAMAQAADQVADLARVRAPIRTGRLRGSIHVERLEQGKYAVVAGKGNVAWWGIYVEEYTGHPGPTRAQPFLEPSFEAVAARLDGVVRRALADL